MGMRTLALVPAVLATGVALAACTETPAPDAVETGQATPAPSPTATQSAERVFTLPADCTGLLTDDRQQAFAAEGIVLLGGPGGLHPDYYADPTPEEQAGGISCIWGDEADPLTIVTVSAASAHIKQGVILGFDLVEAKPHILVHLKQARAQNVVFLSGLLTHSVIVEK